MDFRVCSKEDSLKIANYDRLITYLTRNHGLLHQNIFTATSKEELHRAITDARLAETTSVSEILDAK